MQVEAGAAFSYRGFPGVWRELLRSVGGQAFIPAPPTQERGVTARNGQTTENEAPWRLGLPNHLQM
jgi:hypothetical protein